MIAPALARLSTGGWYEPWLLLREHLGGRVLSYFRLQAGALALWTIIALVVVWLNSMIPGGTLGAMAAKAALCAVLLHAGAWLAFHRMNAFHMLGRRVRTLVRGPIRKATEE